MTSVKQYHDASVIKIITDLELMNEHIINIKQTLDDDIKKLIKKTKKWSLLSNL
jgi:hypothetical protein